MPIEVLTLRNTEDNEGINLKPEGRSSDRRRLERDGALLGLLLRGGARGGQEGRGFRAGNGERGHGRRSTGLRCEGSDLGGRIPAYRSGIC